MRSLFIFALAAMGYAFTCALLTVGVCFFIPHHECYFDVEFMHYLFVGFTAAGVITELASEFVLHVSRRWRNRNGPTTVLVYGIFGPFAYLSIVLFQLGTDSLTAVEVTPWILSGVVQGLMIAATRQWQAASNSPNTRPVTS